MAEVTETTDEGLDTKYRDDLDAVVAHLSETSTKKANGAIDVRKADYAAALEMRGVSEKEVKRVTEAVDFVNTAAALVAVGDLEEKISGASAEELKDEDYRKKLSSTVFLPTHGGRTEVEVRAERWNNVPARPGDPEGTPTRKASHGGVDLSITTKARIHKPILEESRERIRAALGITE